MNKIYNTNNNQTFSAKIPIRSISFSKNINESQNITLDTLSNISNHSNIKFTNYNQFYNNNVNNVNNDNNVNNVNNSEPYYKRRYTTSTMKKTKKKVKFNEVVDVFVVKSYKKYNKCGDRFSLDDVYYDDSKDSKSDTIKKRKTKNCECFIY